MENACVVVADGSRARIFVLNPGGTVNPPTARLGEVADLVNPERRLNDREVYSDAKPGMRAGGGGHPQITNDHRDHHAEEMERRFARLVTKKLLEVASSAGSTQVVVAAEPKMLGHLRKELPDKTQFRLSEIAKDLSHLTESELHDHLARQHLLPDRRALQSGAV